MAGTFIMSTVYGIDVKPEDDSLIELAEKALQVIATAGTPGAFLVDSLPLYVFAFPSSPPKLTV